MSLPIYLSPAERRRLLDYYTLRDADGFYSELRITYGIDRTWVTFANTGGPEPQFGHCTRGECSSGTDYRYVNIPQASKIDVPNPKDVITAALPSVASLKKQHSGPHDER
ncbi:hypothetical protein F4779DRAFT_613484 [Xylariaceae sp. FL0662B]|nr:hypothetical protein F4779DRAFT_613484 [Xylariaceae sp. FL0662B]